MIDALRTSAESASRLVATSSGYRAGLLASIAASCTASYTVALVPGGRVDHDLAGKDADNAALCDALAIEHSTIYGYGIVSAQSPPDVNDLVVDALAQHRQRRDDVIAMLAARKVTAPVAAAGYQLPMLVGSAADAARLAVRMENDGATAWRAVIEHAETARGPRVRRRPR